MKKAFLAAVFCLSLMLAGCSAETAEVVTPVPEPVAPQTEELPKLGTTRFSQIVRGEGSNEQAQTPEGVEISLEFDMPTILNAAGNPAWEAINDSLYLEGEWRLIEGEEYWGSVGLVPEGKYSVVEVPAIATCNERLLSIRYERTENLAQQTTLILAQTYDLETGAPLSLGELFSAEDGEVKARLLEELEALQLDYVYGQEGFEGYYGSGFYLTLDSIVLLYPIYHEENTGAPVDYYEAVVPLEPLDDIFIY